MEYFVMICFKLPTVIVSGNEGSHEGGGRLAWELLQRFGR